MGADGQARRAARAQRVPVHPALPKDLLPGVEQREGQQEDARSSVGQRDGEQQEGRELQNR
eukprot:11066949-Alexandrium_andersonii.AAC.1